MRLTKRANITNRPDSPDATDASPVDEPRYRTDARFPALTPLRLLAVSLLALGLANCSSAPRTTGAASPAASAKVDPKYGVKPSPRVVASGSKVPKGGGRAMVGKPYVVAGKRFTPRENDNYVAVGTASWYGSAFHGRKTANGEVFDKYSFAAAHPTLPLPSYVRVTNLSNQRSMIVRVNDRGPFHGNRLIDLSRNAAEALDFHRQGTARVKVEYVGRASLGGSDDRKLLATLNNVAPAAVPTLAPQPAPAAPLPTPTPAPAPVVTPAPVMMASAAPAAETPVAEAPAAAPVPAPAEQQVADAASARPTARTLVAHAAESPAPASAAPTEVAALPQPAAAPSRTLVATSQTLAFADAPQNSPLTELVREVGAPQAAVPLPPSRPAELARRRTLLAVPGATEALQGEPAAPSGRRALVANLADGAPTDRTGKDRAGVYFEPMPLSQLTPQRFVAFGNGPDSRNSGR
ncbi:septal ring lytic transglycosylase RlpA family protein [Pseudochelatococcus sp. B33]